MIKYFKKKNDERKKKIEQAKADFELKLNNEKEEMFKIVDKFIDEGFCPFTCDNKCRENCNFLDCGNVWVYTSPGYKRINTKMPYCKLGNIING